MLMKGRSQNAGGEGVMEEGKRFTSGRKERQYTGGGEGGRREKINVGPVGEVRNLKFCEKKGYYGKIDV